MRAALDCRTVTAPKTGDRTYALNLARALDRLDSSHEFLFYSAEATTLLPHHPPRSSSLVLPALPAWSWTPFRFPIELLRRRAGLAHVQYIIPPIAPCPVVTTIHDIAFRRFPALFPARHRLLLNWLIPIAARGSAAVITCSESTRRDLVELMDLPPHRIAVTPYAADPCFRPIERKKAEEYVQSRLGVPLPYVLALGLLQPRKNLPRLVRAWNRIAPQTGRKLVITGGRGWDNQELDRAVAAARPGCQPVFTGYAADADLPYLYAAADLFVYPSLYEGFGFPPLEAMACGTPVITSKHSSLPEVAGEAAELVDPHSEKQIAEAMLALLQNPERRAELSARGMEQAARFSWQRTARETVEVYERVLSGDFGLL